MKEDQVRKDECDIDEECERSAAKSIQIRNGNFNA